MTERFCKVCEGWHRLDAWPHNCLPEAPQRSSLPAPMVVTDTMAPVQSMLDGKMYDSKRRLRDTYRAAGVVEVGNDPQRFARKVKSTPDSSKIRDTIDRAEARYKRGERVLKKA